VASLSPRQIEGHSNLGSQLGIPQEVCLNGGTGRSKGSSQVSNLTRQHAQRDGQVLDPLFDPSDVLRARVIDDLGDHLELGFGVDGGTRRPLQHVDKLAGTPSDSLRGQVTKGHAHDAQTFCRFGSCLSYLLDALGCLLVFGCAAKASPTTAGCALLELGSRSVARGGLWASAPATTD
jgi:hypothetical protein